MSPKKVLGREFEQVHNASPDRKIGTCMCMYNLGMRTTVEIKPEHRSALLALASRRGEKGFSGVLGEAIESFLNSEVEREKRRRTLLSLEGSLSEKEGDDVRRIATELRENWR
jgi:hypothetical protein